MNVVEDKGGTEYGWRFSSHQRTGHHYISPMLKIACRIIADAPCRLVGTEWLL
jgi:hypothetical protein